MNFCDSSRSLNLEFVIIILLRYLLTPFHLNFAQGPGILGLQLVRCKTWFYLFFYRDEKRVGEVLEAGQAAGVTLGKDGSAAESSTKEERAYTLAELQELGLVRGNGCNFTGAKITNVGTINCGVVQEKTEISDKPAKGWFYRIFYWRGVDH